MGDDINEVEECLEYIETIIKGANGMPQFESLRGYFPK